jgi:outer membrane protein assembly factor BamB
MQNSYQTDRIAPQSHSQSFPAGRATWLARVILLLALPVRTVAQSCVHDSTVHTARESSGSQQDSTLSPGPNESLSVLTQHNDNARTGAFLSERTLNISNVCATTFGKLFTLPVTGQVYAQPLYVASLPWSDGNLHNVVYVATMHNEVYAFDADDPTGRQLWRTSVGTPLPYNFMPMMWGFLGHNIKPEIGITSTPVIDLQSRTLFLVAKSCAATTPRQCKGSKRISSKLHALDLVTGKERAARPIAIEPTCAGHAHGSTAGQLAFDSLRQLQRAGLLLANGNVYAAFGSHQDPRHFHGWVVAYNETTLDQVAAYCTTPNTNGGAIWQAGNGLAADAAGNVYAMTGNGGFDNKQEMGNSFIKLSPDLKLLDWFTPANQRCLGRLDVDLGSAGPVLLTASGLHLVVGGGKEGVLYLLDGDNLGHLQAANALARRDHAPCARSGTSDAPPPLQALQTSEHYHFKVPPVFGYRHVHGSPVIWRNSHGEVLLYTWPEMSYLRAFRLDATSHRFSDTAIPGGGPTSTFQSERMDAPKGMPGGILAISDNAGAAVHRGTVGAPSGILWASMPRDSDAFVHTVKGILCAFRADDLTELWNSEQVRADNVGDFAKYTPPTVAGGKVYLATFSDRVDVYGILSSPRQPAELGRTDGARCGYMPARHHLPSSRKQKAVR